MDLIASYGGSDDEEVSNLKTAPIRPAEILEKGKQAFGTTISAAPDVRVLNVRHLPWYSLTLPAFFANM